MSSFKMTNYFIAPSILASDITHLADQIAQCESAGADWIHIDVMDGRFVPNITMGPFIVEACRGATKLPLDVHLMIERPEEHLEAFAKAGAAGLTVHVETCPNLHRTLGQIRSLGCRAGVTVNPGTPISAMEAVLHMVDLVLILSVNPGFSGQAFIAESVGRVAEVRRQLNALNSQAYLEVDGGLAANTVPLVQKAGANAFVAGNSVFKHPRGIAAGIRTLRDAIG
jgi:ribulose-phosphate 3-epimerase